MVEPFAVENVFSGESVVGSELEHLVYQIAHFTTQRQIDFSVFDVFS